MTGHLRTPATRPKKRDEKQGKRGGGGGKGGVLRLRTTGWYKVEGEKGRRETEKTLEKAKGMVVGVSEDLTYCEKRLKKNVDTRGGLESHVNGETATVRIV